MSNIGAVPDHIAGDEFTQAMWQTLEDNINDGIVNQVCAVRVAATASHASGGTESPIVFATELYDGDGMHDPATNPSRLTCQTAGVYHIGGYVKYPADTKRIYLNVRLNGSTDITSAGCDADAAAGIPLNVSCDYYLNVSDYVELTVDSADSLTIAAADMGFWMHRV